MFYAAKIRISYLVSLLVHHHHYVYKRQACSYETRLNHLFDCLLAPVILLFGQIALRFVVII